MDEPGFLKHCEEKKEISATNFLPITMSKFAIPYSNEVAKIKVEELLKSNKLLDSLFMSMSFFYFYIFFLIFIFFQQSIYRIIKFWAYQIKEFYTHDSQTNIC